MKKVKPMDWVILLSVLCLSALSFLLLFGKEGRTVRITCDSGVFTYDLSVDRRVELESGGIHMTLVIEDGSFFVEESDCPDKTCVHSGKISRCKSAVVCVPAHMIAEIGGDEEVDEIAG